jgi:hypothetical protein
MVVCLSVSDGRCVSGDWGLISIGGIGCLNFYYKLSGMPSYYTYLHLGI